jgi:WhiB family transcriptional regulator, redox-sensing transcriptional regulator
MAAAANALRTGLPRAPRAAVGQRGPAAAGPGMTPEWLALLHVVLAGTPHLDGAACSGRPGTFDQHSRRDRNHDRDEETALCICTTCPALSACGRWLDGLEPFERPHGVVAGRVVERGDCPPTGRKPGPKATA